MDIDFAFSVGAGLLFYFVLTCPFLVLLIRYTCVLKLKSTLLKLLVSALWPCVSLACGYIFSFRFILLNSVINVLPLKINLPVDSDVADDIIATILGLWVIFSTVYVSFYKLKLDETIVFADGNHYESY